MKDLLGLVGLLIVALFVFSRIPASLSENETDTGIVYNDTSVKSNDLFFGLHVRASSGDARVSGVGNAGFLAKKSFRDSLLGGFNGFPEAENKATSLVASTQTNTLFDDTDSEVTATFVNPCEVRFVDIKDHPYQKSIFKAAKYCLVDGYSSTKFYPDNYLRRSELAKMVVNMMLLKLEGYVREFKNIDYDPFLDVKSTHSLAPYMSYVSRLGVWDKLFVDESRRRFDPDGFVSSEDIINLLSDISRLYPSYMEQGRISVTLGKDAMTRGEVLDILMQFFWDDQEPEFTSEGV